MRITNSKFKYYINILHHDTFASNVSYIHTKTSFIDCIKPCLLHWLVGKFYYLMLWYVFITIPFHWFMVPYILFDIMLYFFHPIDLIWSYFKFLLLALTIHVGTESEISFSLMSGVGKNNRRGRESMSITSASAKLLPNPKPVRIAAINGKPRVQRYLSRECKFLFYYILFLTFHFNHSEAFIIQCNVL